MSRRRSRSTSPAAARHRGTREPGHRRCRAAGIVLAAGAGHAAGTAADGPFQQGSRFGTTPCGVSSRPCRPGSRPEARGQRQIDETGRPPLHVSPSIDINANKNHSYLGGRRDGNRIEQGTHWRLSAWRSAVAVGGPALGPVLPPRNHGAALRPAEFRCCRPRAPARSACCPGPDGCARGGSARRSARTRVAARPRRGRLCV